MAMAMEFHDMTFQRNDRIRCNPGRYGNVGNVPDDTDFNVNGGIECPDSNSGISTLHFDAAPPTQGDSGFAFCQLRQQDQPCTPALNFSPPAHAAPQQPVGVASSRAPRAHLHHQQPTVVGQVQQQLQLELSAGHLTAASAASARTRTPVLHSPATSSVGPSTPQRAHHAARCLLGTPGSSSFRMQQMPHSCPTSMLPDSSRRPAAAAPGPGSYFRQQGVLHPMGQRPSSQAPSGAGAAGLGAIRAGEAVLLPGHQSAGVLLSGLTMPAAAPYLGAALPAGLGTALPAAADLTPAAASLWQSAAAMWLAGCAMAAGAGAAMPAAATGLRAPAVATMGPSAAAVSTDRTAPPAPSVDVLCAVGLDAAKTPSGSFDLLVLFVLGRLLGKDVSTAAGWQATFWGPADVQIFGAQHASACVGPMGSALRHSAPGARVLCLGLHPRTRAELWAGLFFDGTGLVRYMGAWDSQDKAARAANAAVPADC